MQVDVAPKLTCQQVVQVAVVEAVIKKTAESKRSGQSLGKEQGDQLF